MENKIASELFNHFLLIESNLIDLLKLATSEDEKNRLRAIYAQAWRNYNLALNRIFDMNDKRIQEIYTELEYEGQQLDTTLKNLHDIVHVINVMAKTITIGATIALA